MLFTNNLTLTSHNSLGIAASARYLVKICNLQQLFSILELAKKKNISPIIFGSGSNIILNKNNYNLVLIMKIFEISLLKKNKKYVYIRAGAGVNWDSFVRFTLNNCCYGLENLSFIPGTVGACPIQNIGAYGVEIKDYFYELTAVDTSTHTLVKFSKDECRFGYRNSIFKNEFKDRYIITSVTFQLNRKPKLNIHDINLTKELEKNAIIHVTPEIIREYVILIRKRKLPDIKILGNAGSFFVNPIVHSEHAKLIHSKHPNLLSYQLETGLVKLSAGWLIDQCGWRGYKDNFLNVGIYQDNPLVLVNLGGASGKNILAFSSRVMKTVFEKFAIQLKIEPVIY